MPAHGPPRFSRSDLDTGVGARIEWLREARGLTQEEVADAASISARTLARHEEGVQIPSEPVLRRLATALDVQISELAPGWKNDDLNRLTSGDEHPGIGLRVLRKERGISLEKAAREAGVHASTLSRFERGLHASHELARRARWGLDDRLILTSNALAKLLGFSDAETLTDACEKVGGEA